MTDWGFPDELLLARVGGLFGIDFYIRYVMTEPYMVYTKYTLSAMFEFCCLQGEYVQLQAPLLNELLLETLHSSIPCVVQ